MTILKVFCDGGARGNPGPAGIGFVVKSEQNEIIFKKGIAIGEATNNIAEYQAVIAALNWLIANKSHFSCLQFFLDSLLVVQQLKGIYKVKNEKLRLLHFQIKNLETKLAGPVFYQQVPRSKNHEADYLVNTALDNFLNIR